MTQQSVSSNLQIGSTYTRKSIATATGISQVGTSREGIGSVKGSGACILFVTLDKVNKPETYSYRDYFDGQMFHWDSQNRQNASSPLIKSIVAKRVDVLLFCRVVDKIRGATQAFVYCGLVEYYTHDANTHNPVHVVFQAIEFQSSPTPLLSNIYSWRPSQPEEQATIPPTVDVGPFRSAEEVDTTSGGEINISSPLTRSNQSNSRWPSQELPSSQPQTADSEQTEPSISINTQSADNNDLRTRRTDPDSPRGLWAMLFQVIKNLMG